MAQDTFVQAWNKVLLRCPSLSPKLAQDMVVNAFRRLAETRRWSWLVKSGQFIAPAVTTGGTVTVTQNSTTVTGLGTVFTAALVGQQFRTGAATPIYTIAQVNSATSLELDAPWGGVTAALQTYQIYLCYFTVPADFHQFICLWDPAYAWQLYLDISQSELNQWDPQRASIGNSYMASFLGYSSSQVGLVGSPVQTVGSGPIPGSGGTFTAPANAIFTIKITLGGASGTATYQWNKNNGTYTAGVLTDPLGQAESLQDGISIAFPLGAAYVLNDTFVISATAIANAGLPRYELWPHQQANHVWPFIYESRATDLSDPNAVIPRYVRGDLLVDMAMEEVSAFPGMADKSNPYFSLANAERYRRSNERQIQLLEVQDDNVYLQDLSYSAGSSYPFAVPYGDARWLQSHAI